MHYSNADCVPSLTSNSYISSYYVMHKTYTANNTLQIIIVHSYNTSYIAFQLIIYALFYIYIPQTRIKFSSKVHLGQENLFKSTISTFVNATERPRSLLLKLNNNEQ